MLAGMLRGAIARRSDSSAAMQILTALLMAFPILDCVAVAECQT